MKKLVFIAAVATAAIFPAGAFAALNGVVVGKSPGSLAVASKGGVVHTVKTCAHVRIGALVHVNGAAVRVVGRGHAVRIHAIVVRRAGGSTVLAGGHSLFAVRSGRGLASVLQTPTTGAVVDTIATVSHARATRGSGLHAPRFGRGLANSGVASGLLGRLAGLGRVQKDPRRDEFTSSLSRVLRVAPGKMLP